MAYDRTLVQIRERSFLELLDLALIVVRSRPRAIAAAAAVGIAPWAALDAWLVRSPDFPPFLFSLLVAMQVPWATAPLTVVLGGLMFGERRTAGQVARALARGLFPMLLYQSVVRLVAVLLVLPMPWMSFYNEVILLERGRWWRVPRRCGDLGRDRGGELFAQWLAQLVFGALFVLCTWLAWETFASAMIREPAWIWPDSSDLYDARTQAALWVAVAFFGVVRFFSYIDRRIRLEGWEVELRLRAVGAAMEEAGRWSASS